MTIEYGDNWIPALAAGDKYKSVIPGRISRVPSIVSVAVVRVTKTQITAIVDGSESRCLRSGCGSKIGSSYCLPRPSSPEDVEMANSEIEHCMRACALRSVNWRGLPVDLVKAVWAMVGGAERERENGGGS